MLQVFRNRNFAFLWVGQVTSTLGDWFLVIAIPIYIYGRTGSPLATGIATMAGIVPDILFGSLAGVFVDRFDRRKLMIGADLLRAALLPLLLLATQDGLLWVAYVVAALQGTLSVVFGPARTALVPRLVGEDQLIAANSADSLGDTLASLIGPAVGGVLLGLTGLAGVVLLDALSFLVSGLCLACIVPPKDWQNVVHRETEQGHVRLSLSTRMMRFWQEWFVGLHYLRQSRVLMLLFVVTGIVMVAQGIISILWVVFVRESLGGDAVLYGGIQTAVAIGTLVGGLVVGAVGKVITPRYLVGGSGILVGMLLLIMYNVPVLPLVIVLNILVGIPAVGFFVVTRTLVQQHVTDDLRGRVFGTLGTTSALCLLGGMMGAGVIGELVSAATVLNVAGMLYLVAGSLVLIYLSTTAAVSASKQISPS